MPARPESKPAGGGRVNARSGAIDRERASDLMRRAGISALVLSEPEAIQYATATAPGTAGMFRRAGAGFVVIPERIDIPLGVVVADWDADAMRAAVPDAVILTHPTWIERACLDPVTAGANLERRIETALSALNRPPGFARPPTYDLGASAAQLAALLARLDVARGAIGIDLDFVPAADLPPIESRLDGFSLRNGSPVLDRLRAIKSDREIGLLRLGIAYSEQGMARILTDAAPGMVSDDLVSLYRAGVRDASRSADHLVTTKEYLFVGAVDPAPATPAQVGDPVKADMICGVDGYGADMSRNFVFGTATADQARLHAMAENAFEAGLAVLVPGRMLGDVHRAVSDCLGRQGIPSYRRGHFGHGVGNSVFSEQWPFIAAGSDVAIEPGMVLAFEVPLYVDGVARFNVEDQFLITARGAETMNRMPRALAVIGGGGSDRRR